MGEHSNSQKGEIGVFNDFELMRDTFQELADICDSLVQLEAREKAGENVKKEAEATMGLLVYKLLQIQSMGK